MSTVPASVRYTHIQGGWTKKSDKFQFFESEENLCSVVCNLLQPFMGEVLCTVEIFMYECSASFQPQPFETGTSPAFTLPYESEIYSKWDEMILFSKKYEEWPYVDICAICMLSTKTDYTFDIPVHIFYRKLCCKN